MSVLSPLQFPDLSSLGTALVLVILFVAAAVVFMSYIGSHR